jgi:N-acyl-D-aspartate/D-glutamate deacylase
MQAEGVQVIPQVSCRPLVLEFQFKAPFPLESLSLFKPVSAADHEGRKRIYADPTFRTALREKIDNGRLRQPWSEMRIASCDCDDTLLERKVGEVAGERGLHPVDLVLDLSLQTDLEARFRLAVLNTDEDVTAELLADGTTMLGLSDAGAHASQLCDAGAPTELLGHWVRDKGVLSLEQAVWQLTGQPAEIFAIRDRGRLRPGLAADITVFEPDTVACAPLRRVRDFPAGADRLVADALGIRAVIVNGTIIREQGADTVDRDGPLPGHVLRGGPRK